MKNFSIFRSIPMVIGFVVLFTIFVTKTSYSQNADKKEKQKTVILKVTTDKDGKKTVIDTTFTTPEGTDPQEIEEMDSLHNIVEKIVILKKGNKNHMRIYGNKPHEFEYEFNVPCPPDPPMDNEFFERHNWGGNWNDDDRRVFRFPHKGQTLTDILGDIPMDKVRNYSIKNTKYGKKIVIEIED